MDAFQLFKRLGAGAKFNLKRFQNDAERLKVIRPQTTTGDRQKELDYFNDGKKGVLTKRKANDVTEPSKKLKGMNIEEDDGEDDHSESNDDMDSNEDLSHDEGSEDHDEEEEEEEEELTLLGSMKSKDKKRAAELKANRKKGSKNKATVIQDEINQFRNTYRMHVQGSDIPSPMRSFDWLQNEGVHAKVLENLASVGFTEPTPIQMQAVPLMMQRREVLACAPTGSGKTAAFVIPIIHHLKEPRKLGFRALVLAPTRELATQTYRVFTQLADGTGLRIHYIDKASTAAKKFGPQSSQKFDILITTPNRLVYMLKQEPPVITLKNIQWFVVDESDKLFEEGKTGFRDQLAMIYKSCDGQHVRRAMFSATFAHDVEQWCKMNLDNVAQVYIGQKNSATETVKQELMFVGDESGKMVAMRNIIQKGLHPPVLIFVQSKDRAKELFQELIYDGINVDVIHADKTQLQRDNIVKGFRSGRIWVLICTELMGRGMDFKGVNLVINFDFPNSTVSYIHRIGRTGRAGRPGTAITFFTESDVAHLRRIANVMKMSGCEVPEYMLHLKPPKKNERRKMARSAPQRKSVSTLSKEELKNKNERLKMKRQKLKKANNPGKTPEVNAVSQKSKMKPAMKDHTTAKSNQAKPRGVSKGKNGHHQNDASQKGSKKKKSKQRKAQKV